MTKWTITVDGKHQGPFTETELQAMLDAGQIDADTPAWTAGRPDFEPLRNCLPGILPRTKTGGERGGWLVKSGDKTLGPMSGQEVRALVRIKVVGRDALLRRESEQAWRPLFGDGNAPEPEPEPAAHASTYAIAEAPPKPRVQPRATAVPAPEVEAEVEARAGGRRSQKKLLVYGLAFLAILFVGLAVLLVSSERSGGSAMYAAVAAAPDADDARDQLVAQVDVFARGISTAGCEEFISLLADWTAAVEGVLRHPDLPRAVADGRWSRMEPRWNAALRRTQTSMVMASSRLNGCTSEQERRAEATFSQLERIVASKDKIISDAVMQKVIIDTDKQLDRQRRGIPEPTPHSCIWCKRPMTQSDWLWSNYCSPKCKAEAGY